MPISPLIPTGKPRTPVLVICKKCQEGGLFWSWNFYLKRPHLIDKYHSIHACPTPQTRDVFPGWCETCKAPELLWLRKQNGFELTESYGLPHSCERDPNRPIEEISEAKCKYCNTTGLFWVKVRSYYTLTHPDGTKHSCVAYTPYQKDWAEAKRMDYALEKAWLKSIPDGTTCKKCQGPGYLTFFSKNKRLMIKFRTPDPVPVYKPCKHCKRIGRFTVDNKKQYLSRLRKKYWPFRGGIHKWKAFDGGQ